jgi:UDP-N-acetylmuramate--alanine ligase
MDHPDIFSSEEDVYRTFYRFACKIPRSGLVIGCFDSPRVKKLALSLADRKFDTYGFSLGSNWRIVDHSLEDGFQIFKLKNEKKIYGPFKLKLPGKHNALNATAAIIVSLKVGIREETLQKYLVEFSGVERRFQVLGSKDGVLVVDDYAHHPTAIKTTLAGAREFYPNRKVWCVFQPHTYSRTKELFDEFAQAFTDADSVIVSDIYASAREKSGRIHARHLVAEIKKYHKSVFYVPTLEEITDFLKENAKEGDVVIVMGAGDIYKVGQNYLKTEN